MHSWLVYFACNLPHLLAVAARPTESNQFPLTEKAEHYPQTVQTIQAWRFNATEPSVAKDILKLAEVWAFDA